MDTHHHSKDKAKFIHLIKLKIRYRGDKLFQAFVK